ncbi:hypothetical protein [Bacillus phage Sarmo]|nr:hypothetical protein [Bacillus phage Sarmo]
MFTIEDFVSLVEEEMLFASWEVKNTEDGSKAIYVEYEDYKASTFHYYNITVKGNIVHLYIFADGQDDPIDILMPENLSHAYDIMKAHDDLMWTLIDVIDRGELT